MNPHSADSAIAKASGSSTTGRLIVASNRLPVSISITGDTFHSLPSSGGLASAVGGLRSSAEFAWIGWPGTHVPAGLRGRVDAELRAGGLVPVHLSQAEEAGYYRDYCNDLLWPLFHYFTDKAHHEHGAFETYEATNRRFADAILAECQPGDRVWVHDFHLMLVPGMLRDAMPDLEIGFFLHVPWPSSEVFRQLPDREAILRGLLGADYVAFHTNDYANHFRSSCLRVLGLDSDHDGIAFENRRIGIGRHPIGIDTDAFQAIADSDACYAETQELRRLYQGRRVILGVERLDYSKGIMLKLAAFERFLENDPDLARSVTLLQVIVPSRLDSSEYQELKGEIEAYVSRINGRFGGPGHTPVEYLHRNIPPEKLVALYQFADVGLVTPVRDGMNLVAQEFVLCQARGTGILILSEFAGAAQVLGGSILINPWNIDETARTLGLALNMSPRERQRRMQPMIRRVEDLDCKNWFGGFLSDLGEVAQHSRSLRNQDVMSQEQVQQLAERCAAAPRRTLLLDYDGTLRELAPTPEMAQPSAELQTLIADLADLPHTDVHIVSGRPRATLEDWFGSLPVHLSAEHGSIFRAPGGTWTTFQKFDLTWMATVREMLDEVCTEVPGSAVEQKQFGIAWHYRLAEFDYGLWRARELLSSLEQQTGSLDVEVLSGNKVIEVRARGANKGSYAQHIVDEADVDAFVLCIGDDRTDVDMYRAMPDHAHCIHVGHAVDDAAYEIESPDKVRRLLQTLTAATRAAQKEGTDLALTS